MIGYYENLKPNDNYINSEELIGQKLWFHTNRTNRNRGRNGMIGIYYTNGNGNRGNLSNYYTNEVRIKGPVKFQTSESGSKRIKKSVGINGKSGKRQLIAGVSGIVTEIDSENISGMSEITYSPFDNYPWFYLVNDNEKKEVISCDEVYFYATEKGKWGIFVKNPVFK